MDINQAMRSAVLTGKTIIGRKRSFKAIGKEDIKLFILASNFPEDKKKVIEESRIPYYVYKGTNVEMGYACGKTFPISLLAVIDPGNSNILDLRKETNG
ncbi:MAG TPA: 50S ribosomal protein L30e [Thermoplasmata archaeon]|nr:50S ribosomal protein L30e [Thermoplasmata archaeon]